MFAVHYIMLHIKIYEDMQEVPQSQIAVCLQYWEDLQMNMNIHNQKIYS